MTAYDDALAYATAEGTRDGTNAAGWYVMDAFGDRVANLADAKRSAAAVLRGIEDGDPAVLDTLPYADLSGQWADTLTGPALLGDAFGCGYGDDSGHAADEAMFWHGDDLTAVCDAYGTAYAQAAADAIATAAREVLA